MNPHALNDILLGAIAMGFLVAAAFFWRFWRQSHDRFFLLFSLAFFVESASRVALALSERPQEGSPGIYLVRLLAYALILFAVLDKNDVFGKRG